MLAFVKEMIWFSPFMLFTDLIHSLVNLSLFKLFFPSWPLKFSINDLLSFLRFYCYYNHQISCCFPLFLWQKGECHQQLWLLWYLVFCTCFSWFFLSTVLVELSVFIGEFEEIELHVASCHCHLSPILLNGSWLVL